MSHMRLGAGMMAVIAIAACVAAVFACRPRLAPGLTPAEPTGRLYQKAVAEKDSPTWGEAVDGVQARLRPTKLAWRAGEVPEFVLDVRNLGKHRHAACAVPNCCWVEWDGQLYFYGGPSDPNCKATPLEPCQEVDEWLKAPLSIPWINEPINFHIERLPMSAGKHTVRVSVVFDEGAGRAADEDKDTPENPALFEVKSQAVEVELADQQSDWGEAVRGVQARLRVSKAVWGSYETPLFHLDVRNVGRKTLDSIHLPFDAEVEVDGQWYFYVGPVGTSPVDTLEPDKQCDDWVKVAPDRLWAKRPTPGDGQTPVELPQGKHVIRIAYPLSGEDPPLRPVSGSIKIETRQDDGR